MQIFDFINIYIACWEEYLLKIALLKCVALFPWYELLWWLLYTCGLQNCPINPPHKCYRYDIIFTESQNKVSAIARAQLSQFPLLFFLLFFFPSKIILPRTWSPARTKLQLLCGCCLRLTQFTLKLHRKEIQIYASLLLLSVDEHPGSLAASAHAVMLFCGHPVVVAPCWAPLTLVQCPSKVTTNKTTLGINKIPEWTARYFTLVVHFWGSYHGACAWGDRLRGTMGALTLNFLTFMVLHYNFNVPLV